MRFYAGVPLETADGYPLGTLCAIDHVPRDLKPEQIEALRDLGRQVLRQLELRRNLANMASTLVEREQVGKKSKRLFQKMAVGLGVVAAIMLGTGTASYRSVEQLARTNDKASVDNMVTTVSAGMLLNLLIFGGVSYMVTRQMSESDRVKETLEKERNFISTVLETGGALVVVFDMDGRIVRFNRACEETTGYSFNEVKGKILWDIFLSPEEAEAAKSLFNSLSKAESQKKPQFENYWITREGSRRLISWSNTVILDSQNSVKYIISTGIDITERKQAEDNLRAMQNQIIVQEKLASLGSLTAGIAHEIRNPLNFVNNFAEVSEELTQELGEELENQKDQLEPSAHEYISDILNDIQQNLSKINHHGQRASKIVSNMLLHARGGEGNWAETDINSLLAEAVNLAYHSIRGNDTTFNVAIETEYDESIEKVKTVQQDLSRAFINIISNACYTVNEKKKELGDSFSPKLYVQSKNLSERVEIRIQDNGKGMPQEVLDKLFTPFFTTKPTGEGTGLGLSITHDIIVHQHRGDIKVETEVGSYAKFIITLPKQPV